MNGDAGVNAGDLVLVRNHVSQGLPAGEPAPSAAPLFADRPFAADDDDDSDEVRALLA